MDIETIYMLKIHKYICKLLKKYLCIIQMWIVIKVFTLSRTKRQSRSRVMNYYKYNKKCKPTISSAVIHLLERERFDREEDVSVLWNNSFNLILRMLLIGHHHPKSF